MQATPHSLIQWQCENLPIGQLHGLPVCGAQGHRVVEPFAVMNLSPEINASHRLNQDIEDLRRVYLPSLRHRVLLNFEAQAEGIESDDVLLKVLDAVPEKADEKVAMAKAG